MITQLYQIINTGMHINSQALIRMIFKIASNHETNMHKQNYDVNYRWGNMNNYKINNIENSMNTHDVNMNRQTMIQIYLK